MYTLILLNGGVGTRVGAGQPKQLLKIRGIPLLVYSLVAVDKIEKIDQIILNYPTGWKNEISDIIRSYAIKTPVIMVEAGGSRHASVAEMLPHVKNDHVIIHESARPMVEQSDFEMLLEHQEENISYMLPIPFTVAPVEPSSHKVIGSLERDRLRNVQLPQKYNKESLEAAHAFAASEGLEFTEDATLVATAGYPVFFMDGHDRNIKVTTPVDVTIATHLLDGESASE